MTNGDKFSITFGEMENIKVKSWLNRAERFISIGEIGIINLDHVSSVTLSGEKLLSE